MKPLYTLLLGSLLLHNAPIVNAQSIAVAHDTVTITTAGTVLTDFTDTVINNTTSTTGIHWKVIATDFPADWVQASGFCDPGLCYNLPIIWPASTTQNFMSVTGGNVFYLAIDFPSTTSVGCYYIKVRMENPTIPTDTATETYIVCKSFPAGVPQVSAATKVSIYPDPAVNVVSVAYDATANVQTINIYNAMGKTVGTYKATSPQGTNLDLANMPPGIYFVRLLNSAGGLAGSGRFMKQ